MTTTDQTWHAAHVVMATGWCDQPAVPALAAALDPAITQVVPSRYRNPRGLPDGGVLVVGASATGVQLADELAATGRPVVLAVGRHSRMPRRYRGMDIFWWLERIGSLDRTIDEMADPASARREPSLQLVGRPDHADLDLATLQAAGVELAGRLIGVDGSAVRFARDLPSTVAAVDERRRQLLGQHRRAHRRHRAGRGGARPRTAPSRRRRRRARTTSTCGRGASPPSSGRPGTGAATRGSRCPSSTPRARSATTGASRRSPACTSSASASSTAAARASSTASAGTRSTSPTT